jgi:hypothetical protein
VLKHQPSRFSLSLSLSLSDTHTLVGLDPELADAQFCGNMITIKIHLTFFFPHKDMKLWYKVRNILNKIVLQCHDSFSSNFIAIVFFKIFFKQQIIAFERDGPSKFIYVCQ